MAATNENDRTHAGAIARRCTECVTRRGSIMGNATRSDGVCGRAAVVAVVLDGEAVVAFCERHQERADEYAADLGGTTTAIGH